LTDPYDCSEYGQGRRRHAADGVRLVLDEQPASLTKELSSFDWMNGRLISMLLFASPLHV
jgi:hypothetical protein